MKQFTFLVLVQLGLILLQTTLITCEENLLVNIILIRSPSISPPSSLLKLHDGPSLRHKLDKWSGISVEGGDAVRNSSTLPENDVQFKDRICRNAPSQAKRLTESIIRAVNYYEAHINLLDSLDASVGLQVLEGSLQHILRSRHDNLHLSLLNRTIPLISQVLDQTLKKRSNDPLTKEAMTIIGNERNLFTRRSGNWKSSEVLQQRSLAIRDVGNDVETVWPPLNAQCIGSLVGECEVPYACKKTYLDAEPQSQYMLTHQALYLLFANQKSCVAKHPETFNGWEENLESQCAKMLKEAELLARFGYPDWGRDLFAEYVFICGLGGFPNFLRSDWIQEIQSWQSESDFGCFVNPGDQKYFSTEIRFPRKSTSVERLQNVEPMEQCSTHFSSTSLSALAVKLEWLHDNCLPVGAEYEIMMAAE